MRYPTWYWRIGWWLGYHGIYQIGWWRAHRRMVRSGRYERCEQGHWRLVGDVWIGWRCMHGRNHAGRHKPLADARLA